MFNLREENEFWLDDVALQALPPVEPGKVSSYNQVANGSFEVGKDKWYATFRENKTKNTQEANENNCFADIKSINLPNAPDGRRVLSFEVFPKCRISLSSAFFPLKYGHETTVEFSLKTSNPKRNSITAQLLCGEFPNVVKTELRTFKCRGPGWQRMSFKAVPKPSAYKSYTLCFSTSNPGIYQIDDIRVWQGEKYANKRPAPDMGWEPVDDKHPANFYVKGEKPAFKILVQSEKGAKHDILLKGNVVDAWEREIAGLDIKVLLNKDGFGEAILKLPECTQYGTFKVSLKQPGKQEPGVEILYSVPHELSYLVSAEDSFFGGHVNFSPYNLLLAKKAGFRWLRLHPPNDAKWIFCEPEKGKFVFNTKGAARAHAMGFKLLGVFDSVPAFYADKPAKARQTWYHTYPPKGEAGWKAYENYVRKAVNVYAPYITAWEICNEPNGAFLQVPQGMVREEIYLEYVKRTNKALADRKDITLVGGAFSGSSSSPFMGEILKMGVGKYIDVLSFHHYSPIIPAIIATRAANIKQWASYKNRDGVSMPIWHTEGFGGFGFGSESVTWMSTTGHPFKNSQSFHRQWATSGYNMQAILCFKALGVKKHFLYAAFTQPSGHVIWRNDCSFMADINGLPKPCLTAHAAAVYFLDGASPAGLEFKESGPHSYGIASFIRNRKKLDVVWSNAGFNADSVAEIKKLIADRNVFDMMGNPVEAKDGLHISASPLYLLEK